MIDLYIKQNNLEVSSESSINEIKIALVKLLNSNITLEKNYEQEWLIKKLPEENKEYLLFNDRRIVSLEIENYTLHIQGLEKEVPHYDDFMFSIRSVAVHFGFNVFSVIHGGAKLPKNPNLSIDSSYFKRDKAVLSFFEQSRFIPRFALEGYQNIEHGKKALVLYEPYYVESKDDKSIHIINNSMLKFLIQKDNQRTNNEFSYKVAESMNDFAKKYDRGLIPLTFYQNYGNTNKIINSTRFDVFHINRKVFIEPYIWNFDDDKEAKFFKNKKDGLLLMDKVRKGEDLDMSINRIIREELRIESDYVGAHVLDIDFDRDKEGILTPRLKMNVFVHGLTSMQRESDHDWEPVN